MTVPTKVPYMHIGLRTRLLALVAAALLPAFGFIAWQAREIRTEAVAEVQRDAQRLAGFTADQFEQAADMARELLLTLAAIPVLREPETAACARLLAEIHFHRSTILCALRLSFRPASRRRRAVRGVHGATAALPPGTCRAGVRRAQSPPRPAAQARRSHRHCPRLWRLDGAGGRRVAG